MTFWIVEPRDTLVVRDGRPVADGAGGMKTLAFPWPSSVAGLARTRAGLSGNGTFGLKVEEALRIAVRGPYLVDLTGAKPAFLLPAPQDAIWFDAEPAEERTLRRLRKRPIGERVLSDLPESLDFVSTQTATPIKGKPMGGPAFWSEDMYLRWLAAPSDDVAIQIDGVPPLVKESRVHVGIEGETQTAEEGVLYSTQELRLTALPAQAGRTGPRRLGLAFRCDDERLKVKGPGVVSLGGERRISYLSPSGLEPPRIPDAVRRYEGKRLRVLLLTPALFREGFAPASIHGARVTAAVVGRPQGISGWDFEKDRPKASRWMAPAGSVYWVEPPAEKRQRQEWIEKVWFEPVSTEEQDCRDGFGVAVVGVE